MGSPNLTKLLGYSPHFTGRDHLHVDENGSQLDLYSHCYSLESLVAIVPMGPLAHWAQFNAHMWMGHGWIMCKSMSGFSLFFFTSVS